MQIKSKNFPYDLAAIRGYTLRTIVDSPIRITPSALEKMLIDTFGMDRTQFKSVVRDMVADGELTYTYEYGSTYLERSFAKPVRIAKHIVLQPPGHHYCANPSDVVVSIKPGVSFGAGNHPTTRLAIKGIEFVLLGDQLFDKRHHTSVLDIGTGSGVLLITAMLCGMQSGLGVDTDACARVEAAENVRINTLEERVAISGQPLAGIRQRFSIILANLRFPSLKNMLSQINEKADTNCFLIVSGIRDNELDDLLKVYEKMQFKKMWAEGELGWSGVVLRRINQ